MIRLGLPRLERPASISVGAARPGSAGCLTGASLLATSLLAASLVPSLAGATAAGQAPASRAPAGTSAAALAQMRRAHAAYRAGEYAAAARLFNGLGPKLPRLRDYVLYFAAESEFFAGNPDKARPLFGELERERTSRLAALAGYRVADCLWAEGQRAAAVVRYRRLLGASAEGERPSERLSRTRGNAAAASGTLLPDPVVGRYRVALALEQGLSETAASRPDPRARERAARAFRALHLEFPGHPLAEEAAVRASRLQPAPSTPAAPAGTEAVAPEERLRRAATLSEERRAEAAEAELAKLPANLPPALAAERDYLLGMTKYRSRQDYAGAARLLLGVVGAFSGEKAASAAFHGTRALSRVDRDDEAIAGYRQVVARFGSSRFAPEAQFLSGWLELNRGRPREALPGLEDTVRLFPRSEFAVDAAWFVALARVLLKEGEAALPALDRYQRLASRSDGEASRRAPYFRARALALLGRHPEATRLLEELARREPFDYYGLLARSRLRERGTPPKVELPAFSGRLGAPPSGRGRGRADRDPLLDRVEELAAAGLDVEAGLELVRGEAALLGRLGRERGLPLLLDRYPRVQQWRRAYQLADSYGSGALAAEPRGPARVFWEASFPKAFPELVERFAGPAGNPDFFLLAIMRKESAFLPTEISYADARGLVQLLPATGARLAAEIDLPFSPEQLFDPQVNVRLGARYLGGLARKFGGNVALAAGAYNGGARAMMRWCDQNGRRPLDEFVELVTYDQSRLYIKRVLGIYARYRYLYTGRPWEPSLVVEGCQYRPGGPDY